MSELRSDSRSIWCLILSLNFFFFIYWPCPTHTHGASAGSYFITIRDFRDDWLSPTLLKELAMENGNWWWLPLQCNKLLQSDGLKQLPFYYSQNFQEFIEDYAVILFSSHGISQSHLGLTDEWPGESNIASLTCPALWQELLESRLSWIPLCLSLGLLHKVSFA